jgi:CBS-domain-containing membrane protein
MEHLRMAPTRLQVRDVMSRDVHTVKRNEQLAIADALMKQERVRHLPVLARRGRCVRW